MSIRHALFYRSYGPENSKVHIFSLGKSIISFFAMNFGVLGPAIIGAHYHTYIMKAEHNLLEKHTTVQPGHFENYMDLEIYLDKNKGHIQPQYGTEDFRVPIAQDGYPVDMYGPLEERSKESKEIESRKSLDLIMKQINVESEKGLVSNELRAQLCQKLEEVVKLYQR